MSYIENPKTKGSGIICAIPQKGRCPNKCKDCFFQSGRSYLEPLEENLPNIPPEVKPHQIVRINDGNDSYFDRENVIACGSKFPLKFYNTSYNIDLDKYDAPVVLTLNPSRMTDREFYKVDPIPDNLMFVRFRVNMWNLWKLREAVQYYADRKVPIMLTFMAYYEEESIPEEWRSHYMFRKRTINSYYAIKTSAWRRIVRFWDDTHLEKWVYTCSKIEGERGETACRFCGNCVREFMATMERMSNG